MFESTDILFQSLFSWNSPSDSAGQRPIEPSKISFNPCFRGTRPRTISHITSPTFYLGFNPCFRGTRPRTPTDNIDSHFNLNCFNPCFRGTRPRTLSTVAFSITSLAFQSLFSWNSPSDSAFFSSFSLFLSVKPAFSRPPSGMSGIY